MRYKAAIIFFCLALLAAGAAVQAGMPVRAETAVRQIVVGEEVTGDAVYAQELSVGKIEFSVTLSGMSEGDVALIGLLRNEAAVPDLEDRERGLVFSAEQKADGRSLAVYKVTALQAELLYEMPIPDGELSVTLLRTTDSKYKLYVNGTRLIAEYADVLSDVLASDFSLLSRTHLALSVSGAGQALFGKIESAAEGETAAAYEWLKSGSAVASDAAGIGSFADETACFSAWQNVAYARIDLDLSLNRGGSVGISFSDAPSSVLSKTGGGKGIYVLFYAQNDGIYMDVYGADGEAVASECLRYAIGDGSDLSLRVELKKKMPVTGFALFVNGTRVQKGEGDILDEYTKEDVGRYIDADTTGTYLSLTAENASVTVGGIASGTYDPEPVANEKAGLANDSAYGTSVSEWTGEVMADENGVITSASGCTLNEALGLDYVAFDLGFVYLSDSDRVLDSYVSFGLSSAADPSAVLPEASNEGNSIFFLLSLRSGILYISGYARYLGELSNFLAWTALPDVSPENDLHIEFVYYNYELTLYINGESLKTSYGSNPLNDYYSLYYENEDYKTYLCFANYCYADETKPTLSAENAARYRVYNIENELPRSYISGEISATVSEELVPEKMNGWLGIALPAGCVLLVSAGAYAAAVLIRRRKERAAAKPDGGSADEE